MIKDVIKLTLKLKGTSFRLNIIIEISSCFRNINLNFKVLKKLGINFKSNKNSFVIIFTIDIH